MKAHFLIIGMLLFIVSLLISLNIFFQQSLQLEIAEEFSKQQQLLSQSIAENITDFIRIRKERVHYAAGLLAAADCSDRRNLAMLASELRKSRRDIPSNFGVVDGSGELAFFEGAEERRLTPPAAVVAAARQMEPGKAGVVTTPEMLYITAPLPNPKGQQAIVFISVTLDEIVTRFSERLKVSNKGNIWILDKNGTLLFHPVQRNMVGKNVFTGDSDCLVCHRSFDIERNVVRGTAGTTGKHIAPGGEDKILSYAMAGEDMSLVVFVSSPFSEITNMTRQSMRFYSYLIISILMTTVVVSTALIYFNKKRIQAQEVVKRQEQMEQHARELEDKVLERTAELMEEKEKLNSIVSAIGSGILLLDRKGKILWSNQMAEAMAGFPLEGHSCEELCYECEISGTYSHGNVETVLAVNLFGREGKYYQVTTAPVKGSHGELTGYIRLIQDVTELKKMEEQMSNSEKLASIGRLAAGIAHEIGNPLTSIFSFVQILRELEQDEFKKDSLDTVSFHINRISDTLKQLSGFTKMPMGEPRESQVNDIIESSLSLIQYDKRAKDVTIVRHLAPDLPTAVVDANQLSQVFINLILNAIDAMPDGGTLTVRSEAREKDIAVHFVDTGIGIPKEALIKIFDPFYTTKEKGTGLGLAVSYNIVKKMHGSITVESEQGVGTTFTVTVPRPRSNSAV